jgi:hypothetical protein
MGAADEPMKVLFTSSVRQFILENVQRAGGGRY